MEVLAQTHIDFFTSLYTPDSCHPQAALQFSVMESKEESQPSCNNVPSHSSSYSSSTASGISESKAKPNASSFVQPLEPFLTLRSQSVPGAPADTQPLHSIHIDQPLDLDSKTLRQNDRSSLPLIHARKPAASTADDINESSRLNHYLREIVRDLDHLPNDHFPNVQTRNSTQPTIQEFVQELGVSVDDVQLFAKAIAHEPVADVVKTVTNSKVVAQKIVYSAFAALAAVAIAKTTITLNARDIERFIQIADKFLREIEMVEVRFEMFPEQTSDQIERACMQYDWITDDKFIAVSGINRSVKLFLEAKRRLGVTKWNAARSFRLCIIAVRNALCVDGASFSRAREIEKILFRIDKSMKEGIRLLPHHRAEEYNISDRP